MYLCNIKHDNDIPWTFHFVAIKPSLAQIQQIPNFTLKIHSQGHGQGQIRQSHLRHIVQSIYLLFVSWQSDHFWPRYTEVHIWPWKFKVKVTAKVKFDHHIWGLEFNQYVCFLFHGNRTIFGRNIANFIFDFKKIQGLGHNKNRPKSSQVI